MFIWKEATAGSDATLSDLKVGTTTIAGFASATTTYTAELTVEQLQFHKLQRL
jgi:hypothetical protein